ncbi:MAG: tRNA (guanosine(46)-N7)-methyltransferase TrmB [Lachnospiraceae bacterium]|nr:tRNA (guanosine(46)-N7)-methyltransferase TrmB [Lachnospiraceae bacterium]
MRLKNIPGAKEAVEAHPLVLEKPEQYKGRWSSAVFHNGAPVRLEIGMGKGTFLTALAQREPDVNFIGIEKMSSVLFRALEKRDALEEPIGNLYYLRFNAEYVTDLFGPGEIDRIYLNFSDPWPKDRHADRRLTSRRFLKRYEEFLKPGGLIEFKTDNKSLFAFSLEQAAEAGWEILASTTDLHKDPVLRQDNIMTEYEDRFVTLGEKICKMIIRRP